MQNPASIAIAAPARATTDRIPPHAFFLVSALFHYLGPSFAVLLFARIDPLGVAWLRIASAAVVFGLWRRPWRYALALSPADRRIVLALGIVLAAMNSCFYLAIARLPLGTVGAIEFLGPIGLAAIGLRSGRNVGALGFAVAGVFVLTDVRFAAEMTGTLFAFANCALFVLYIVLGHRMANAGGREAADPGRTASIDRLAGAMAIAAVTATPWGLGGALPAFRHPVLLLAGAGVGVCSSVIPYVADQLAMARLPRATFSLMLALLPVFATVIGAIVLRQIPTVQDASGITLVVIGVAMHQRERKQSGIHTAGVGRDEGIPDLPGHDELRQPGRTHLAP
jgi:inner membrane transporter RhtA